MTAKMFDEKGKCKYCNKPTRAKATSLCNACYKLDLAIKNNPTAAKKILADHTEYTYRPADYYVVPDSRAYRGTQPKEEQ